jgi:hypothetical protein
MLARTVTPVLSEYRRPALAAAEKDPVNLQRTLAVLGCALLVVACGTTAQSPTAAAVSAGAQGSAGAQRASAPASSTATSAATPAVAASCDATDKPFDATTFDLTGAWAGDDGGIYYLRQLDSFVWWSGMSGRAGTPDRLGLEWSNVARGVVTGVSVDVNWADIPRGGIRDGGTMKLSVQDDGTGNTRIVKVSEQSGDFGNRTWTPCKAA